MVLVERDIHFGDTWSSAQRDALRIEFRGKCACFPCRWSCCWYQSSLPYHHCDAGTVCFVLFEEMLRATVILILTSGVRHLFPRRTQHHDCPIICPAAISFSVTLTRPCCARSVWSFLKLGTKFFDPMTSSNSPRPCRWSATRVPKLWSRQLPTCLPPPGHNHDHEARSTIIAAITAATAIILHVAFCLFNITGKLAHHFSISNTPAS